MKIKAEVKDRALGGPVYTHKFQTLPRIGEYLTGEHVMAGGNGNELYEVLKVIHGYRGTLIIVNHITKSLADFTGEFEW